MKSSLRSLIILIAAIFTMTCGFEVMAKPDSNKTLIKEAAVAYDKGDFDTAFNKFYEAYQNDNSQSSLLYNMGRVLESKADYASANEYYKNFIRAAGSDENAREDALERIKKNNEMLEILGAPSPKAARAPKAAGGRSSAPKAAAAPAGGCIDINTASTNELMKLKGIGEKKANDIIASRNSQGAYRSADELTRIKGIGPSIVEKLKDQVCPISGGGAAPAAAPSKPAVQKASAPAKAATATAAAPKAQMKPTAPSTEVLDI